MRIDRFALLHGLRAAANRERERRQAAEEAEIAEARELFYRYLDEIAARRRAVLGYVEPSAEERERSLRELDAWAAEHYGQAG
jgi:hypothetical protein